MSPQLIALFVALASEAPSLFAKLLGIWTNNGAVTEQEIATFIQTQWPGADTFFHPAPPAATPPVTP
ncbi:MAG: hypothetical protein ABR961_03455 [Thermoanaerobaculaceae bacterium]|jgi:hypothetical protein